MLARLLRRRQAGQPSRSSLSEEADKCLWSGPARKGVSSGNKEPPKVPLQRWPQVRCNSRGHSARGRGGVGRRDSHRGRRQPFFMGRARWLSSHSRTCSSVGKEAPEAEWRRRDPQNWAPSLASDLGLGGVAGPIAAAGTRKRASLEVIGFGGKTPSPLAIANQGVKEERW